MKMKVNYANYFKFTGIRINFVWKTENKFVYIAIHVDNTLQVKVYGDLIYPKLSTEIHDLESPGPEGLELDTNIN